jgi:diguanylate cyclase (GGDEF)-like protein
MTATRLHERTRDTFVARVGPDEFAVLVRQIGRWEAGQLARALRRDVLDEPIRFEGVDLDVTYRLTARTGPVMGVAALDADWPLGADMLWRVQSAAVEDARLGIQQRLRALERTNEELTTMGIDEVLGLQDRARTAERLAARDPLTNIQNRRAMRDRIDTMTSGYVLAFVDVDDLRALNGDNDEAWSAGDAALSGIATLLQDEFGDVNVGRWGGDEYVLVVSGTTETSTVKARLQHLIEVCSREVIAGAQQVTFSGGVAACPEPTQVDEALRKAHQLTKKAKETKATILDH